MKKLLSAIIITLSFQTVYAVDFDWNKIKDTVTLKKDQATVEAEYLKRIEKDNIKEQYGRKIMDRKPSGYMTVDEYNALSRPTDKSTIDYGTPQVVRPNDTKYVPKPIYKLARYNDPPGSPELSIPQTIFKTGQLNLPGITAPNFYYMVYPAVYYYPERGSIACDLFVVALRDNDSSVNKILKANIANRFPDPILSTDKELTNSSIYRTLTPIDFSADSTKLLVKEKIGSSADGIWETNIIVYDFSKRTSYKLIEVRDAITYYWKEYKGLDLNDKRWDIYPLGFSKGNPDRIMLTAYAYTGEDPVFLGVWSIDYNGEQSRLISLKNGNIEVASNGFKIVKDGVVPRTLSEQQEKLERIFEKKQAKDIRQQDKLKVKEMKSEMKDKLKEVDKQFKREKQEHKLQNKIQGTTDFNENTQRIEELQKTLEEKHQIQDEKEELQKQLKELKAKEKDQNRQIKQQLKDAKNSVKNNQQENTPPNQGQALHTPNNTVEN